MYIYIYTYIHTYAYIHRHMFHSFIYIDNEELHRSEMDSVEHRYDYLKEPA